MEQNNTEYYSKVLHGYIVHERSRSGYSTLLLGGKALILLTALCGIGILEFASPAGSNSTYGAAIMCVTLAALMGLGWVEERYGKPVLHPRGLLGFWHWKFEMPKHPKGKSEAD